MDLRPIIEVTRGTEVESVHFGSIALVDSTGELQANWSDPEQSTFMRSAAKPFQALPLAQSMARGDLELDLKELALACASHVGREMHLEILEGLINRTGIRREQLQCGLHTPLDKEAAMALQVAGSSPDVLHNNCAGKHIGMLLAVRHRGQPEKTYLEQDHPLQREILSLLSKLAGVLESEVAVATDGCSAPNFALPLRAMALAFARLADPSNFSGEIRTALDLIYSAMTENPELVSGPGKLDAVLMKHGGGTLLAKEGAEGVLCLGQRQPQGKGFGVAIKIWDGDKRGRARAATALELVAQLGWLSQGQQESIRSEVEPVITTRRNKPVGVVRPVFQLEIQDG